MVILLKRWLCVCVAVAVSLCAVPCVSAKDVPTVSATAAILYEPTSGRVLFEKNADQQRAMASTTKLMTALVAADWCEPDRDVIVPDAAVRVEGSSLGLRAGDYLTMRDLLTGLLVVSGNDAANAVALTVCNTIEQFADLMNQRAAELGMTNTHFVTPSGLDAEGHYTTARDMAVLATAVLKHPMLREICSMARATVHIGNPKTPRMLKNHNRLLTSCEGTIGLKTGFTKKAGRCLVSAAERGGVTLIAVTLHAPDDWNDHQALYDYGFSKVALVDLALPHFQALSVVGGEHKTICLTAFTPAKQVLPIDRQDDVKTAVHLPRFVWAPVRAGDVVGEVIYTLDQDELCRVPILAVTGSKVRKTVSETERFCRGFGQMLQIILG